MKQISDQKTVKRGRPAKPKLSKDKLDRLLEAMHEAGISKVMVARHAKVTDRTVHNFFVGKYYNPSIHHSITTLVSRMNNIKISEAVVSNKKIKELQKV